MRLNLTLLSTIVIVATCVGFLSLALYKVTWSRVIGRQLPSHATLQLALAQPKLTQGEVTKKGKMDSKSEPGFPRNEYGRDHCDHYQ